MTPSISVVIVNYNNLQYLSECLASIFSSSLKNFEVIVVDNHTTDGDVLAVTGRFQGVQTFILMENKGFAEGTNYGIQKSRGEYIFLLNNDTKIIGNNWDTIINIFENDINIGAIQPMIIIDGTSLINNCGLEVNILGFSWNKYYRQPVSNIKKTENIAAFSGAAVILRKSALEQVGLFDDQYFMYHEDVDISCRLRRSGWKIQLEPSLVVAHHYSYKREAQRYYYLERNRLLTAFKTFPLRLLLLAFPAALCMEVGMIYFSIVNGWFLKKLKTYGDVLLSIPWIIQNRRKLRVACTDKAFSQLLKGSIEFEEVRNPLLNVIANPILKISRVVVRILL